MKNGPNGPTAPETEPKKEPPKIIERPRSPFAELIKPIAIKPKPEQTITLNAIKTLQDKENKSEPESDPVLKARSKTVLPLKPQKPDMKTLTMSINTNSNKSVMRVLNDLSKLLNVDTPKQWILEDKTGTTKDMFRCKIDNGEAEPMDTSVDVTSVLTSGAKFCRHCDTAVQANMVKKKKSELGPLLSKSEKEETH